MEKHSTSGHSIEDVPSLLIRRYNQDSLFDFRNIELVGYKKISDNTIMFYSDTFYRELDFESIHKHYSCERLGRITIFLNGADTASYSMAEILKNLPIGRSRPSADEGYRNVVIVNIKLHVKNRDTEYPFTLHADMDEAEVRIVGVEKREVEVRKRRDAKGDAFRGIRRLEDFQ